MSKIQIVWLSDYADCETCGGSSSEGAIVYVDGKIVLSMVPVAHCFGGDNWSKSEVIAALMAHLGHKFSDDYGELPIHPAESAVGSPSEAPSPKSEEGDVAPVDHERAYRFCREWLSADYDPDQHPEWRNLACAYLRLRRLGPPPKPPIRMLVDQEWLDRHVETDPDEDCEATSPQAERAPPLQDALIPPEFVVAPREVVEPFYSWAKDNVAAEEDGGYIWSGLGCQNERIRVWFGPSEFGRLAEVFAALPPPGGEKGSDSTDIAACGLTASTASDAQRKSEVRHGKWTIFYDPPPIPCRSQDYGFQHDDYDATYEGEEDGWVDNGLAGRGASVEDCLAQIADIEEDRKCG